MGVRKLTSLMAAAGLCLSLSGCASFGADVEAQLRPPKAVGEQGRIEAALGTYIASTLTQENYVLKYPRGGEYRSAFVVEDLDSDGNMEALAFYRLGTENGNTHLNLLRQTNGEWGSVSDYEGAGTDIDRICFGDMNGDGVQELFVSWNMYSSRAYQLSMYTIKGNRLAEKFNNNCASMTVGELTGDGREDCLLFELTAESLNATLWSMKADAMEELGHCAIGSGAMSLKSASVVSLSEKQRGVFVDYTTGVDRMRTTLVCWDGQALTAPLYDPAGETDFSPERPALIPSGDVDKDGVWEWPTCSLLTGFSPDGEDAPENTGDPTRWLTTFWSYDPGKQQAVKKLTCLYNSADGYYLLTEAGFSEKFTSSYNAELNILWLYPLLSGHAGDPILAIRRVAAGEDGEEDESLVGRRFQTLTESPLAEYQVWYREDGEYTYTFETLQYMLTLL